MYSGLEITQFAADDQDEVQSLINQGLGEHWGEVDPSFNPDLFNIAETYKNDFFLVARKDGEIVGTGALVHRSDQIGEIVRMSVASKHRRKGIGNLILDELIKIGRENQFTQIILETTETWEDVIAFYMKYGFEITHYKDGDVYFSLKLI